MEVASIDGTQAVGIIFAELVVCARLRCAKREAHVRAVSWESARLAHTRFIYSFKCLAAEGS